jgi:hypothetical protein
MTTKTKAQIALELMEQKGYGPGAAAREAGVSESAVFAERRKQRALKDGHCKCCGAPVDKHGKYVPLTGD